MTIRLAYMGSKKNRSRVKTMARYALSFSYGINDLKIFLNGLAAFLSH